MRFLTLRRSFASRASARSSEFDELRRSFEDKLVLSRRPRTEVDTKFHETSKTEDWKETIEEELNALGIELPKYEPGTYRILCPECEGGSTSECSLSVTITEAYQHALYNCFRATCGWRGVVKAAATIENPIDRPLPNPKFVKPITNFEDLDAEAFQFFQKRGISESVLQRNGIQMEMKGNLKFIAFPYRVDNEVVNVKYRAIEKKNFHQAKDAQKVFFGLDDVKNATEIIIVEGEMDKLALEMAGMRHVISVPDGAPSHAKEGPIDSDDRKFSFMESGRDVLEKCTKVILATDNDPPGNILAEELARRIGAWKCWRVNWPKDLETTILNPDAEPPKEGMNEKHWYRKDANEVLMKDSIQVLQAYIQNAQPYPVKGLLQFVDFFEDIQNQYLLKTMCPSGYSTGWPGLDTFYKVVPGELTVVSGVPNSGKSEWIDALSVQLAEMYGWNIAFASMEKYAWDHGKQLIEKHTRKPFFENVHYSKGQKRMTYEEMMEGLFWVNEKFPLIIKQDDHLVDIDWILEKAKLAVLRFGIRGLVIDPYNELDHGIRTNLSETDFVSFMLSKIKRFAHTYGVHVWLVAHPRQLHDWRGEPPNLYDISGSAHFVNKADAGIVIHRNWQKFDEKGKVDEDAKLSERDQYMVRVIVRKMRNKTAGKVGECILKYNIVNGTYEDLSQQDRDVVPSSKNPRSKNDVSEKTMDGWMRSRNGIKPHR